MTLTCSYPTRWIYQCCIKFQGRSLRVKHHYTANGWKWYPPKARDVIALAIKEWLKRMSGSTTGKFIIVSDISQCSLAYHVLRRLNDHAGRRWTPYRGFFARIYDAKNCRKEGVEMKLIASLPTNPKVAVYYDPGMDMVVLEACHYGTKVAGETLLHGSAYVKAYANAGYEIVKSAGKIEVYEVQFDRVLVDKDIIFRDDEIGIVDRNLVTAYDIPVIDGILFRR